MTKKLYYGKYLAVSKEHKNDYWFSYADSEKEALLNVDASISEPDEKTIKEFDGYLVFDSKKNNLDGYILLGNFECYEDMEEW